MRSVLRQLIPIGVIMVLALPIHGAEADAYDMAIVATFDDRVYEIGDEVNVTIETFKGGVHFSPRDLDVFVGFGRPSDRPKTRLISLGRYEFSYFIKEDKLTPVGSSSFSVRIMDDDEQFAMEEYKVRTVLTDTFRVRLVIPDPADDVPVPGQTVELEVRAWYMGEPIDLDPGEPRVFAGPYGYGGIDWGGAGRITMEHKGTGIYKGSYAIPSTINRSVMYNINVAANRTFDGWMASESIHHALNINFLNVWINVEKATDEEVTVRGIVTDLQGVPVHGAEVNFGIGSYDRDVLGWDETRPNLIWERNITTDPLGRFVVVVDRSKACWNGDMSNFVATVRFKGIAQVVDGKLFANEWMQGSDWVIGSYYTNLTNEMPLPPGEEATLEFQSPMKDGSSPFLDVDIVIYDANQTYWSGHRTPVANGRFRIPFTTPEITDENIGYMVLTVRLNGQHSSGHQLKWYNYIVVSDGDPQTFWDRHADPDIDLKVEATGDNLRSMRVSVSFPGADGTENKVGILWGLEYPYSMADWQMWRKLIPRPDHYHIGVWKCERPLVYAGQYIWITHLAPCRWEDGTYVADIQVPEALPEGLQVYFLAVVEAPDEYSPLTAMGTVILDESTSEDDPAWLASPEGAEVQIPLMAVVILTIGTATAASALLVHRRVLFKRD